MSKIKNILILVLIGVGIFLWVTRPQEVDLKEYIKIDGKEYELLKKTSDTVYRDTTIYVTKYTPLPPKIIREVIEIPANVDTLAILTDYYSRYVYNDTIAIDSIGRAYIKDVITQNRIESREAKFDLQIPEINNTIFVKEKDKLKVFVGGGLNFNGSDFGLLGGKAGILVKPANDKVFSLDLGAINQPGTNDITPYLGLSAYWKLSFRKK
jgi:hypothetical protein